MTDLQKLFIDADGDICRDGDGDNLVACTAVSDHRSPVALNPEYIAEIVKRFNEYPDLAAALILAKEVLAEFSHQKHSAELVEDEYDVADFEEAYDLFVERARAALSEINKLTGEP